MAADLHCHTKMSDGSASIDEVVLMAKKLGLKTIAVTDHDTFAGATRACVYGRRQGIEVIHGAEISGSAGRGFQKDEGTPAEGRGAHAAKGDAPVSYHAGHGFPKGSGKHQHL